MNFSDFDGVVSQEVVPHELEVFAAGEESEDLSIVVQKLLLRGDLSTSEFLFKEFE
jgi:exosome complex RNA-binding protein Rrp42 (RNase PH superfamily)